MLPDESIGYVRDLGAPPYPSTEKEGIWSPSNLYWYLSRVHPSRDKGMPLRFQLGRPLCWRRKSNSPHLRAHSTRKKNGFLPRAYIPLRYSAWNGGKSCSECDEIWNSSRGCKGKHSSERYLTKLSRF